MNTLQFDKLRFDDVELYAIRFARFLIELWIGLVFPFDFVHFCAQSRRKNGNEKLFVGGCCFPFLNIFQRRLGP
jgi:hypothetical protein